jgi:hypothetical protein
MASSASLHPHRNGRTAVTLFRLPGRPGCLALLLLATASQAQQPTLDPAAVAQAQRQALLMQADPATRERLEALARHETDVRRLEAYNDELARVVDRQAERLADRERDAASAEAIREALPGLLRGMTERLGDHLEADLPFLGEERRARLAELERRLDDPDLEAAQALDRVLGAWRDELDYGTDVDAWRGLLDEEREVDFLRLGRVGLYYLTPDGREGGVWRSESREWRALDEEARQTLRRGLRIAREQRAPELLELPLSHPLQDADEEQRS